MKILSVLVSAAVLAVGLFAGTLAYQAASGPSGASSPGSSQGAAPVTPAAERTHHRQRPVVRWAPCASPAVRHGKVCVTEQVRTVVVAAPSAAAPAPAPAPAAPAAVHVVRTSDDRGEGADRGERGERGSDERGDD